MRFIDDGWRTGAENMARDEALAVGAAGPHAGPTLRVYRFKPPCVTVGRFQEFPAGLDLGACWELGIGVARRPTGGLAILHLDDFTYSAVFPRTGRSRLTMDSVFGTVALGIIAALSVFGVEAGIAVHSGETVSGSTWCFGSAFGVDLDWHGRKICGSAQRQSSRYLLQHGSIFMKSRDDVLNRISGAGTTGSEGTAYARRPVALEQAACRPIEWEELRDAFVEGFRAALGEPLDAGTLTSSEEETAERLYREKYGTERWLEGPPGD